MKSLAQAHAEKAQSMNMQTGRPFAELPPDVRKVIAEWDITLDSVRCYVKPCEVEEKTSGGIIMPDVAKGHNFKDGWVIAAGPRAVLVLWDATRTKEISYQLRPGDRVVYAKYSGAVTDRHDKRDMKNLMLMNGVAEEGDVMGVISHGR